MSTTLRAVGPPGGRAVGAAAPEVPLCPVAARFCGAVAAAPASPLAVALVGPDGHGRSSALRALRRAYEAAGVPVAGADALERPPGWAGAAVLVDDAHLLPEPVLEQLLAVARAPSSRLVIAYRPWPSSPALGRLAAALRSRRRPVVLEPLDRAGVERYARQHLGARAGTAVVDLLVEHTGGVPLLVRDVVRGLQDAGGAPGAVPRVPARVLERLRDDLAQVSPALRRLLLVLAAGHPLDERTLPDALERDGDAVRELVDEARARGHLLPDGALVPLVRAALLENTPAERLLALRHHLLDVAARRGQGLVEPSRALARSGVRDHRVAEALAEAGTRALPEDPQLAAALLAEAVGAGAPPAATAARRAEAAALTGDLDTALALTEELLGLEDPPDLQRGVRVAAACLAQRGMLARSAELYRWLGPSRIAAAGPLAAVAMVGTGDREGAEEVLAAARAAADPARPPTLAATAAALMAQGVHESLEPASTTLPTLISAAAVLPAGGRATLLPDTPAALAALVAMHTGELGVAESVLRRALEAGTGGRCAEPRHRLLLAWVAMLDGRYEQARAEVAAAVPPGARAEPRDEVFLRALQVGLARRTSDASALVRAWSQTRHRLPFLPVDLYALLPLGELSVAAARLREQALVEPYLARARALLERLGEPLLWAAPLHWCGAQAAVLSERPDQLRPHAAALARAAGRSPCAGALARAAQAWAGVLAGSFDAEAVADAARGLRSAGLAWDGSRLAGQAAARTADRRDTAVLLQCARTLHPGAPDASPPAPAPAPAAPPSRAGVLSPREQEVAALVLSGNTYREVGAQLYLSPKTVEHHVARIRQRLGATGRSDLMARLRALLEQPPPS
ncbi:helix-turn-helix transcriptional regulator [Quadrisphaera sp. DSM 44207]|uniref:helix-turn-helix transcriptional regulator n=1 Tax=Quadrisphaera sp. DSM 44207 TaxID=1881057 RepID=UPI00088BEC2A|nr:helix-turn-helix transcriptional regulator [Quadrisphaera sp. DSM 44207]SDQ83739.1 DNA-binding transcriptional regulator, CsgD family [Quadrisphaera sp. DSM 44207]